MTVPLPGNKLIEICTNLPSHFLVAPCCNQKVNGTFEEDKFYPEINSAQMKKCSTEFQLKKNHLDIIFKV